MNKESTIIASAVVVIVGLCLIFGINSPKPNTQSPGMSYVSTSTSQSSSCVSVNGLPDSSCTPGATNPDINQGNISQNICNKSWSTKSIRPTVSYTNALKAKQIALYGYSDTSMSSYEEDHLISLELGGSPTDPQNLWPEPYAGQYGAKQKDSVENLLHKEVCTGTITLLEAQHDISTNWENYIPSPTTLGASVTNSSDSSVSDPDDN